MKIFYCDGFPLPLPPGHRFPIQKYVLLREAVLAADLVAPEDLVVPQSATDEQILRAHDETYLERVKMGQLTPKETRRIGLPWSPELVARARCSVGGTIGACRAEVQRVAIVDCDVHQGNGTAAILADDPTIFTFSIHGARNFPFHKEQSDLDVELGDGTGDADYLEALQAGLARALELADAELAIFLAGADPYAGDQLGRGV
jgi:acetoin utilization deacetylase AcuC-like enzyme